MYICLTHYCLFQSIFTGSEILLFPNIFLFPVPAKLCGIHKFENYLISVKFHLFRWRLFVPPYKAIKFFWTHHSLVQLSSFPFYFVISAHLMSMTLMYSFKLLRTELNKAMENKATPCGCCWNLLSDGSWLANQYTWL